MVSGAERGNRKDSRGIIPNRVSIENRPAVVSKRKRAGDIEVDLMMGKNHKGALLVLTYRTTLYTRLKLLRTKESNAVKEGILACLQNSNCPAHTLTFDNGKAFSAHEKINNRPIRKFNYKPAKQALQQKIALITCTYTI